MKHALSLDIHADMLPRPLRIAAEGCLSLYEVGSDIPNLSMLVASTPQNFPEGSSSPRLCNIFTQNFDDSFVQRATHYASGDPAGGTFR